MFFVDVPITADAGTQHQINIKAYLTEHPATYVLCTITVIVSYATKLWHNDQLSCLPNYYIKHGMLYSAKTDTIVDSSKVWISLSGNYGTCDDDYIYKLTSTGPVKLQRTGSHEYLSGGQALEQGAAKYAVFENFRSEAKLLNDQEYMQVSVSDYGTIRKFSGYLAKTGECAIGYTSKGYVILVQLSDSDVSARIGTDTWYYGKPTSYDGEITDISGYVGNGCIGGALQANNYQYSFSRLILDGNTLSPQITGINRASEVHGVATSDDVADACIAVVNVRHVSAIAKYLPGVYICSRTQEFPVMYGPYAGDQIGTYVDQSVTDIKLSGSFLTSHKVQGDRAIYAIMSGRLAAIIDKETSTGMRFQYRYLDSDSSWTDALGTYASNGRSYAYGLKNNHLYRLKYLDTPMDLGLYS